jgi:nucleotide-binding universal stress UspA family protein
MIEFPHILCPTDLSDASRTALQSAFMLARWYRSRVSVLHATHLALPAAAFAEPVAGLTPAQRAAITADVERFVASAEPGDVPVAVTVTEGAPVRAILEMAHDLPASLIVLGTHGRSGFEHLLMGSVTERVLRKASCPVCTVRSGTTAPGAPAAPFRRILCAVDFSPTSMNALQHALSLAQESGGHLTLLHALDWPIDVRHADIFGPDAARYQKQLWDRAARELSAAVPAEACTWCEIDERVGIGQPYQLILETATAVSADLIVMGVHGGLRLDKHLLGSNTDHVIREAACPVLTVRR